MKFLILFFLLSSIIFANSLKDKKQNANKKKLIILSIDGFPGYYFEKESKAYEKIPNLRKLAEKGSFSNNIRSVFPTLTYPAHTSMITGSDPAVHGIHYNSPNDPRGELKGDWYWFNDDIKVKTILDFANESNLSTGNVYWPVTVGANIKYNIPQFWRDKSEHDKRFLNAISTGSLYKTLSKKTGVSVGEFSGDLEKVETAIQLWKDYSPDVLLVYTTDLDTAHHTDGVYSNKAMEALSKIDSLVGKLVKSIKLHKNKNISLIIVSDHGFKKVQGICFPNKILRDLKLYDPVKKKWNYYFKALGGSAILLKNSDNKTLISKKKANLDFVKKRVETVCKGITAEMEGKGFAEIRKEINQEAKMVLYSSENTVISPISNSVYYRGGMSYYNHGFPPDDEDLKTIMLVYPEVKEKLFNLKQTFEIGCKWLGIRCREGEKK